MLHIRWSKGEADVEGTHADLNALHLKLLAFAPGKEPTFRIDADAAIDPSPYEKALKHLTVERSQGLLTVQLLNEGLYISGKGPLLALLGKNIPHAQETSGSSARYHAHFDQASHPTEVHERSAALTLTVRE